MHKLSDTIKQFYIDNPEGVAIRKLLGVEIIEGYLKEVQMERLTSEVMKKHERLWDVAESYWIFPDLDDYKRIIDECYEQHILHNTDRLQQPKYGQSRPS